MTKTANVRLETYSEIQHFIARGGRVEFGSLAFDTSYPTGGESLTFPAFKNVAIVLVESKAGYVFSYDYTNSKVIAYYADYDAVADGALIQVANETNLSALTDVRYIAVGF